MAKIEHGLLLQKWCLFRDAILVKENLFFCLCLLLLCHQEVLLNVQDVIGKRTISSVISVFSIAKINVSFCAAASCCSVESSI